MTTILDGLAALLLDYYVAATVLLLLVLGVGKLLRQPVERMALAWGTVTGLFLLIALCALPGWPRISLLPIPAPTPEIAAPEIAAAAPASTPDAVYLPPEFPFSYPPAAQKPRSIAKQPTPAPGNDATAAPVEASAAAPKRLAIQSTPLVTGAFLCGSLFMLTWQIVGAIQLRRLVAFADPTPAFAADALREIVGANRGMPRLLVTNRVASAAACGLRRPMILLPADVAANNPASEAESSRLAALLSHEWAHLRGGDLWLLFALRLLSIGLYANPLFWLLRRRVSIDQELIADSIASSACGRQQFASYLVEWARRTPQPSAPRAALGIWQRQAELSRRITMLLDERIRLHTACSRMGRLVSGAAIAGAVIALSFVTLRAAPPATAQATAEPQAPKPVDVAKEPAPAEAKDDAKVKITLHGICTDEQKQPIAGARARLIRFDAGDQQISRPMNRARFLDGFVAELMKQIGQESSLLNTGFFCDPASQRILSDVRSDKDGRIEFPFAVVDTAWKSGASRVYICVQAPGMATEWSYATTDPQAALKPLDFTMRPAVALRGRVTDGAGRPVAGALVAAGHAYMLPKPMPGLHCARTNADGHYEIADLAPQDVDELAQLTPFGGMMFEFLTFTGWVEHPDYATHVIEFKKVPGEANAVLLRPATLTTRVVTAESGEPIAKAALSRNSNSGGSVSVISNERGEFVASGLEPGEYFLSTSLADRPSVTESIDLKPGANELVLRVKRGGIIKGRLIDDATGKPIAKPTDGVGQSQISVLAATDGPKLAKWGSGQVDLQNAEFQFAVHTGKNQISLLTADNTFGEAWVLADADRWKTEGVVVAQDQTVEIELRVKANKERDRAQFVDVARWRDTLLTSKEPLSLDTLKNLIKGDFLRAQREKIAGTEEIIMLMVNVDAETQTGAGGLMGQLMANAPIERSLLAHIGSFPHLRTLYLFHPPGPGDAAIESLRVLQELETLYVTDVLDVTAAGVKHLAGLPKLRSLCLLSQAFDDAALGEIARFPALRDLTCSGKFTDEGLAALLENKELTQLQIATMGDAKFTDAGLARLAKLTKLKYLRLTEVLSISEQMADTPVGHHWAITDDGLRHLAGLADLEELAIHAPQITDAALIHLRGLKRLKSLSIEGSKITPEGMAELRKFLPDLNPPPKPPAEPQKK